MIERNVVVHATLVLAAMLMVSVPATTALAQAPARPNIVVIFGDDIGQSNISAYSLGVMGYKTPNIDRLAREGMMFTDYNQLPYLEGREAKSPRRDFIYFNDDGELVAVRFENWKFVFCEQRAAGTLIIWAEPFTCMRLFKMFNLRMDPFERADVTSNTYWEWVIRHAYFGTPVQQHVAAFLATFKDYPPSQRAASFSIDQIMEKLQRSLATQTQ